MSHFQTTITWNTLKKEEYVLGANLSTSSRNSRAQKEWVSERKKELIHRLSLIAYSYTSYPQKSEKIVYNREFEKNGRKSKE